MLHRPLNALHRSPLAVCLAAALCSLSVDARPLGTRGFARADEYAFHAAPLGGADLPVTSCFDDSSGGTLREVLAAAGEGDTVDLTALTCSTITLAQGQLAISLDDVSLVGPGDHEITIDAAAAGRAIFHTGAGTLVLDHLGIRNGLLTGAQGDGGCIYSAGSVTASHVHIADCVNSNYGSTGGGMAAMNVVVLSDSSVTGNYAFVAAGGVFSGGPMRIERSTISGNTALHASGAYVYYYSAMTVIDSTISGNTATGSSGGGLQAQYGLDMVNSTVTSNIAVSFGGGIAFGGKVNIRNSTIAFNQAADGGGFGSSSSERSLTMTSTIVALNSAGSGTSDIGGIDSVNGSHNLIMSTTATVPPDTLSGDPGIGPIADNGGPTQTHALLPDSIAIDAGDNPDELVSDQRGFARSSGAATDIGAYELQVDLIFADGFEAANARR